MTAPMNGATPGEAARSTSGGWKLRHSAWLLWGLLTCGLLTSVGFVYLAIRIRTRPWVIAAVGWSLATALMFATAPSSGSGTTGGQSSPLSNVAVVLGLLSLVHAFVANPRWLRWLASRQAAREYTQMTSAGAPQAAAVPTTPWPTPPTAASPVPGPLPSSPSSLQSEVTSRSTPPWLQPPSGASSPPQSDQSVPPASFAPPQTGPVIPLEVSPSRPSSVNVNWATPADLTLVLGLDFDRCAAIVAERSARGPFASVDEFARRAGLTALEASRLAGKVSL